MSHNSFGHLFRVTSWGESHGAALGCVIDGAPARIPFCAADVQMYLDRRRPGQNRFTSQRREPDTAEIVSGTFADDKTGEEMTTGAPVHIMIANQDVRSRDYEAIKDKFRPGHADYTYQLKYGIRDWRGGGRASARETAARVAAGALARKVLPPDLAILGGVVQLGSHKLADDVRDWEETGNNPFWCPDKQAPAVWEKYLDGLRRGGSSCGAVIEIRAAGVPAGLGAPVYGKLDADLAGAMMSINAVKGVEIGAGFAAAALTGEENADSMRMENGRPVFTSNQAGGVLGGIATGQEIIVRFAVKPTSSIRATRQTITKSGEEADISVTGRHDPCVGIRAVPVGEAMMACVLADHYLRARAIRF